MKYLFPLLILSSLCFKALGQNSQPSQTQLDLIQKSDSQYKAGWIFLGSGTALIITAIAIPYRYNDMEGSNNQRLTNFLTWTGILSVSTSIPLFLSSGSNGRMAAKLSLESQALNQPVPIFGRNNPIPSLSLKIPL